MIRGIYTAATGLGVLQARMDTATNNLANVSTTGFKQDKVQTASFPDLILQEKVRVGVGGYRPGGWRVVGRTNQGAMVTGVFTEHGPGVLRETDRETDLALSGEGFFVFEAGGDGGGVLYSRDGELQRDAEGFLVNSRGHRIVGEDGPVQVGRDSFTVSPEGVITTAENSQVKLLIVDFTDKSRLTKEGNGYFSAPAGGGTPSAKPGVAQGFLEKSNVEVASEIVNIMEIMRSYEAGQKLMQAHDGLLDSAINRVGTVR